MVDCYGKCMVNIPCMDPRGVNIEVNFRRLVDTQVEINHRMENDMGSFFSSLIPQQTILTNIFSSNFW